MLIRDPGRLELLSRAAAEMRTYLLASPPEAFYFDKIAESWGRARRAPAYRLLPEFSRRAFRELECTTKKSLKDAPWDYVSRSHDSLIKYYETTGTTGLATPTPRSAEDIIWNTMSVSEAWRPLLSAGDRVMILLPSDVVPVGDLVVSVCEYLGVPHIRAYPFATGISDWDRLLGLWRWLRPTTIFVAPGVLLQFTRLLKQRRRLTELRDCIRNVMLLGEVNTPALRARLAQWWQCAVYDASYGSTETGTLAASCPAGQLHLLTTANYFELHTSYGLERLQKSGSGRLVVTPLNLYARPLLRFDTGDDVVVGGDCRCGSPRPTVEVAGRASEAMRIKGSALTTRAVEDIVYGATTANGYLVETDEQGEYGRLVLERDIDSDRAHEPNQCAMVLDRSRATLGLRWDDVVFVNALPATTKSGGSQKNWKRSNIRLVGAR